MNAPPLPDKAAFDAATDQAVMQLRGIPLTMVQDLCAEALAEVLARQFPASADAGRALVAVTQMLSEAGANGCAHLTSVLAMIGSAGVRLIPREEVTAS